MGKYQSKTLSNFPSSQKQVEDVSLSKSYISNHNNGNLSEDEIKNTTKDPFNSKKHSDKDKIKKFVKKDGFRRSNLRNKMNIAQILNFGEKISDQLFSNIKENSKNNNILSSTFHAAFNENINESKNFSPIKEMHNDINKWLNTIEYENKNKKINDLLDTNLDKIKLSDFNSNYLNDDNERNGEEDDDYHLYKDIFNKNIQNTIKKNLKVNPKQNKQIPIPTCKTERGIMGEKKTYHQIFSATTVVKELTNKMNSSIEKIKCKLKADSNNELIKHIENLNQITEKNNNINKIITSTSQSINTSRSISSGVYKNSEESISFPQMKNTKVNIPRSTKIQKEDVRESKFNFMPTILYNINKSSEKYSRNKSSNNNIENKDSKEFNTTLRESKYFDSNPLSTSVTWTNSNNVNNTNTPNTSATINRNSNNTNTNFKPKTKFVEVLTSKSIDKINKEDLNKRKKPITEKKTDVKELKDQDSPRPMKEKSNSKTPPIFDYSIDKKDYKSNNFTNKEFKESKEFKVIKEVRSDTNNSNNDKRNINNTLKQKSVERSKEAEVNREKINQEFTNLLNNTKNIEGNTPKNKELKEIIEVKETKEVKNSKTRKEASKDKGKEKDDTEKIDHKKVLDLRLKALKIIKMNLDHPEKLNHHEEFNKTKNKLNEKDKKITNPEKEVETSKVKLKETPKQETKTISKGDDLYHMNKNSFGAFLDNMIDYNANKNENDEDEDEKVLQLYEFIPVFAKPAEDTEILQGEKFSFQNNYNTEITTPQKQNSKINAVEDSYEKSSNILDQNNENPISYFTPKLISKEEYQQKMEVHILNSPTDQEVKTSGILLYITGILGNSGGDHEDADLSEGSAFSLGSHYFHFNSNYYNLSS